ncbi:MAG: DNA primase [Methylococcaceae bacterium]|jgi:DNA primase
MSGRIPREFISELLVRVDIVDLIDSYVPLKKTGSNFVARCPFHTEKSPSFSVSQKKQFFHCFGCGTSGNAITFLMAYSHLDFVEAVESLADFVGIDVPREAASGLPKQAKPDVTQLALVMANVAAFYEEQLRSNPEGKKAAAYLKARGVSKAVANDFMLGYAPSQWQNLLTEFDSDLLVQAGVLGCNDSGDLYPRFRSRVMFPIRDRRARVLGFGGRILDDTLPKYLNSPETPLFYKGREVYGLYEALEKNAKPSRLLVVEGYMDVIALAQFGIDYAVAALGTAATSAHFERVFRFSSELVLCFDGDNAGRQAVWRAMESAMPSLRDGRQIRIMLLPQGQDPDSLVRDEGVDGFAQRISEAQTLSDYFFGQVKSGLNLTELEACAQLVNKAKPYLEKLPEGIFRDMMFKKLRQLAKTDELENLQRPRKPPFRPNRRINPEKNPLTPLRAVIALLLQNPELVLELEQQNIGWELLSFVGKDVLMDVVGVIQTQKPPNSAALVELFRGTEQEAMINKLAGIDLPIPEVGLKMEFLGYLNLLAEQEKRATLDGLLARGKSLNEDEKEMLRKILQK